MKKVFSTIFIKSIDKAPKWCYYNLVAKMVTKIKRVATEPQKGVKNMENKVVLSKVERKIVELDVLQDILSDISSQQLYILERIEFTEKNICDEFDCLQLLKLEYMQEFLTKLTEILEKLI